MDYRGEEMELGQKLKQARLEAGLSQRQLCGDEITRNMLSQIENGSAKPSMTTLRYLAGRLGKTVSWFLEEDAVTSPNQAVMERVREAYRAEKFREALDVLEEYREPDNVFDLEKTLLQRLAGLGLAEQAIRQRKNLYAEQLLEQVGPVLEGYCCGELERRRLLLLAKARPKRCGEISGKLPGLDSELMARARGALDQGDADRSGHLLDAVEDQKNPRWAFLRGEVYLAQEMYEAAAECFHAAEPVLRKECAARLERCYRELGNYERAYFYAYMQR